jgi:uncharacterized membrane protein
MPILTNKQFVDFFWSKMDDIAKSKSGDANEQYSLLLLSIIDISKDLLTNLDNKDTNKSADIKANLPLLAMISEIQLLAPEVVNEAAKQSNSIKKALSLLENYPSEKRQFLKQHFLSKEQADVFRFDDYRK